MNRSRSRFSRWLRTNASLLVVAASLAFVLLLAAQNRRWRNEWAQKARELERLEEAWAYNSELGKYLGHPFPDLLADSALSPWGKGVRHGFILVVCSPTVCQTCLQAGLQILAERGSEFMESGLEPFAVVGDAGLKTREGMAGLTQSGLVSFRFQYVKPEALEELLPVVVNSKYVEAPLYFHTDGNLRVIRAFKPDCLKLQELEDWIRQVVEGTSKGIT